MVDKAKDEAPVTETPTIKVEMGDGFYLSSAIAFIDSTVRDFKPRRVEDAKAVLAQVIDLTAYFAINDPSKLAALSERLTS